MAHATLSSNTLKKSIIRTKSDDKKKINKESEINQKQRQNQANTNPLFRHNMLSPNQAYLHANNSTAATSLYQMKNIARNYNKLF